MRLLTCLAAVFIISPFTSAKKPTFGLSDTIKGGFWLLQQELAENDPMVVGHNFVEFLGQKLLIGSASLSGLSTLSLDDLTVDESVGDAYGLVSLEKLSATVNEIEINALFLNFGVKLTELSVGNTTFSWRCDYDNVAKNITDLDVLMQIGTMQGKMALEFGGMTHEKTFSNPRIVNMVNDMLRKNSGRFSAALLKLVNYFLHLA